MRTCLACFVVLMGCNTPGPEFRGLPVTTVRVAGSTFDVRVSGNRAQAIRTNTQYAPRLGPIGARAQVAFAEVSGCKVTGISGDAAVVFGALKCEGSTPPLSQRPAGASLECYEIDAYISGATGEVIAEFDCTWED